MCLKGPDEKKEWKVSYFKGPIPYTNLYINLISEDILILLGEPKDPDDYEQKSIGFYYISTDSLTYFEDHIVYLEDYGMDDSVDKSKQDSMDEFLSEIVCSKQ